MYKLIMFSLIFTATTFAQVDISNCSFKFGYIDDLNFANDSEYNDYYELGTGGRFFNQFMQWSFNVGYWNEDIKKTIWIDAPTFSNRSIILAFRYHLFFNQLLKGFIPLDLYSGIDRNFIHAKYIGGSDGSGRVYKTYNKYLNVGEIGFGGTFKLYKYFNLRIEAQRYFRLSKIDYLIDYRDKNSLKLGLMYVFK